MTVQVCQNQNIKFLIFWNRRTLDLLPDLPLCGDFGQKDVILLSGLLSSDVGMVVLPSVFCSGTSSLKALCGGSSVLSNDTASRKWNRRKNSAVARRKE